MTEPSSIVYGEVPDSVDSDVKSEQVIMIQIPSQKQGGRPSYKITEEGFRLVEYLSTLNCTREEIASAFGVAPSVLHNRHNKKVFTETYNRGKEQFKLTIRKSQMRIMTKGNSRMAEFLGKNYLGQTDKSEMQLTHKTPSEMSVEELFEKLAGKKE